MIPGKIIRFLEETGLREESAPPDARIIASTVGTLDPALRALFTRQITLPALIDRREDIPLLSRHYVGKLARQFGKAVDGVSPASMRRLDLDADLAGIRFTQPWTQQRARDWWAMHAPDRLGGRTGPVPY
jgi:transcriptional regulator with AAA-type ATPase domain